MTLAHATFIRPVAVAAEGAVGFHTGLTVAAAGEVHLNLQDILEATRFDGEGAALLLWAAVELSLNTEGHL